MALTRFIACLVPLLFAAALSACSSPAEKPAGEATAPTVLAASSLQGALDEAAEDWAGQGHPKPVLVYAATSALARQVEDGAPADLFISADEEWMDALEKSQLLKGDTRRTLLGNTLVLVAPASNAAKFPLSDRAGFFTALGEGPLAIADPEAVPAGKYAKAAMLNLRLWEFASDKLAISENVRAALALVERGEAPLGVVYGSDARASDKVRVVAEFPASSHPAIRYPAAVLKGSTNPEAQPFLAFLASKPAIAIFARHGFAEPE